MGQIAARSTGAGCPRRSPWWDWDLIRPWSSCWTAQPASSIASITPDSHGIQATPACAGGDVPASTCGSGMSLPSTIAVVVPIFNEEEVLPELLRRLAGVFDRDAAVRWRAILVDD